MKILRKNDFLLILILLISAVCFAIISFCNQTDGLIVSVIKDGEKIAAYSLEETLKVPITDDEKNNTLVIENGKAYIQDATCPDKICVKHRSVSKVGETIVCLPNRLVIEISE